jgi:hypothetical protein
MFATVRLRNPGLFFRVMWSAPNQTTSTPPNVVGSPSSTTASAHQPTKQSANDILMLYLTVISTIATVIALFK